MMLVFFVCADSGVLTLLDFVAHNPHKLWRYMPTKYDPPIPIPPVSPPALPSPQQAMPNVVINTRTQPPTVHPAVDVDVNQRNRHSQDHQIDVNPANVKTQICFALPY